MKINIGELNGDIEIIGGFELNGKEYAVCSYIGVDEVSKIVIVETYKEGDNIKVKEIPADEMSLVLSAYKEIEKKLLGDEENE